MDKTVRIRAYSEGAQNAPAKAKPAEGQNGPLELAMKDAQLEEERSRSLDHLRTIVQLRESLKQEQAKSAEMPKKLAELEARVKELTESDANAKALLESEANKLARKNAQLEDEQNKVLEHARTIAQLRESLQQEQTRIAEMVKKTAEMIERTLELEAKAGDSEVLEAKVKELAASEAKVAELTDALGRISSIAATANAA